MAEDRKRFDKLLTKLRARRPENGTARSFAEAEKVALRIGYPVLVRPSYVLGGRAMEIVYDEHSLREFVRQAIEVSPDHPILIDEFLEDAIEVDVDCVSDRTGDAVVAGIMEHIEEAGIHSGDSACVLPPYTLRGDILAEIQRLTLALARELKVIGLMNVQYAIRNDRVFVLEVNPRASRTVPFVSKATGVPWAKVAARVMAGRTLRQLNIRPQPFPKHISIKESVFPFIKFPGSDIVLGPEMRSTGEVMGIDRAFGTAFAKSQISAGQSLPLAGNVFLTVKNKDKRSIIFIAKKISDLGFKLMATRGTAETLQKSGLDVAVVRKVIEGRPNVTDQIRNGEVDLIINTPVGKGPRSDDYEIRRAAVLRQIPVITTISGASAVVNAIEALQKETLSVKALQDYFKGNP
jgi:carbamoyl-phosphate synthase large subunit